MSPVLRINLLVESDEDLKALRGALLAARAAELAEMRRRSARHSVGYGSDSQRESMSAEASQAERRHSILDRLISAVGDASRDGS